MRVEGIAVYPSTWVLFSLLSAIMGITIVTDTARATSIATMRHADIMATATITVLATGIEVTLTIVRIMVLMAGETIPENIMVVAMADTAAMEIVAVAMAMVTGDMVMEGKATGASISVIVDSFNNAIFPEKTRLLARFPFLCVNEILIYTRA